MTKKFFSFQRSGDDGGRSSRIMNTNEQNNKKKKETTRAERGLYFNARFVSLLRVPTVYFLGAYINPRPRHARHIHLFMVRNIGMNPALLFGH